MSKTVADVLVGVLEQVGVKQIFGLISDSLNPLADAVRRSGIEWIGVRHEEGAALAAAGQAKLTGQLAVCAGSTGPGSTHLVAGLYEASLDHAPILALSGDMVRKQQGTDFIQTTKPDLLFRDVSLYTETISSSAQAPGVIHQAIAAAYAGRGVAHLTLPQDVIGATAEGDVASVAMLKPREAISARDEDIAEIARRVDQASSVVIMCGAGCHGAGEELRALSDRLKAPLIHSVKGKDIMPYDDPHWMGGIGMIGTKPVYHAVMDCDLLLMVGTDYPYSEFLPSKGTVVQIDERQQVLGRRAPTVLGVVGSAQPTLKLLLDEVATKEDTSFWDWVTEERRSWDEKLDKQADLARSKDRIHPQAVARTVSNLAKRDAVFVFDTGLNTLWSGNWIRQSGSQRIIGSFNNAAVGTGLGQANGIQALDRSRQVIALCGDGGFNMLMGEFLTAVHHKLPVKVVIYNNSAFGLIRLEAESIGVPAFEKVIQFPNPDFAAFATGSGQHTVGHPRSEARRHRPVTARTASLIFARAKCSTLSKSMCGTFGISSPSTTASTIAGPSAANASPIAAVSSPGLLAVKLADPRWVLLKEPIECRGLHDPTLILQSNERSRNNEHRPKDPRSQDRAAACAPWRDIAERPHSQ